MYLPFVNEVVIFKARHTVLLFPADALVLLIFLINNFVGNFSSQLDKQGD